MQRIVIVGGRERLEKIYPRSLFLVVLAECCVVVSIRRNLMLDYPQIQLRALPTERDVPPNKTRCGEIRYGNERNRNRSKVPRIVPRSGCRNK